MSHPDRLERLERLNTLKERGAISQLEFDREKARILAGSDDAPVDASNTTAFTTRAPPPESNLVWGILTTLLCFLPFGVVAIVKASSVGTHWYAGNQAEAHAAAESAKNWSIAAAVTGVILIIIVVAAGGYR